jgi:hypothetical protein
LSGCSGQPGVGEALADVMVVVLLAVAGLLTSGH